MLFLYNIDKLVYDVGMLFCNIVVLVYVVGKILQLWLALNNY